MRLRRNLLNLTTAGMIAVFAVAPAALAMDDLERIREDLSVVDEQVFASGTGGSPPVQVILEKTDIKTRDIYRAYLEKASGITGELMMVRDVMEKQQGDLSLQQLGSLLQALKAQNRHFRETFEHGEEEFQSYQLIQKAVDNLDDAWNYWRSANRYRRVYRPTVLNEMENDRILGVKLQAARQAIEDLHEIGEVRQALDRDARFDFQTP